MATFVIFWMSIIFICFFCLSSLLRVLNGVLQGIMEVGKSLFWIGILAGIVEAVLYALYSLAVSIKEHGWVAIFTWIVVIVLCCILIGLAMWFCNVFGSVIVDVVVAIIEFICAILETIAEYSDRAYIGAYKKIMTKIIEQHQKKA